MIQETDSINPGHYRSHSTGIQCIEIAENLSFNIGNAFKYLFRRGLKGSALEDTQKAAWYLRREEARLHSIEEFVPSKSLGPRYEVSTLGRVRGPKGLRKPVRIKSGYLTILANVNGKPVLKYVHALVAEVFIGPCPAGREVAHGDGNRANNAIWNLRYATRLENTRDRILHGTMNGAARNGQARLSWEQVDEIRRLAMEPGTSDGSLARKYSVSRATIERLLRGGAWKEEHREPPPISRFISAEQETLLGSVLEIVTRAGGSQPDDLRDAASLVEDEIKRLGSG